jgi:hypothetical protein
VPAPDPPLPFAPLPPLPGLFSATPPSSLEQARTQMVPTDAAASTVNATIERTRMVSAILTEKG